MWNKERTSKRRVTGIRAGEAELERLGRSPAEGSSRNHGHEPEQKAASEQARRSSQHLTMRPYQSSFWAS